ncbi:MAG: NAD(P)-dependent oxidoreductase [Pseudomonadota bacterium]|nr:NAD(P)-dependent oxidoreductase [Pseudomonadota bacterium]
MKIAFMGLGAMGARMAASLITAGHDLVVWNRSPDAAVSLAGKGATVAANPAEAVTGVDVAIAMVREDAASRRVWLDPDDGALAALAPGAVAIESSTLSVDWTRELAGRFAAAGQAFLDAPVLGSRPQADAKTLIHVAGGAAAVLERMRPVLGAMGSAVHHMGPNGAGAAMKLLVNAMLGIQVAALAELIGAGRAMGLQPADVVRTLAATPVMSPAASGSGAAMVAAGFAPAFPVELVEKDLGYLQGAGTALPVAEAARNAFARAQAEGLGDLNLTAVVKLYA